MQFVRQCVKAELGVLGAHNQQDNNTSLHVLIGEPFLAEYIVQNSHFFAPMMCSLTVLDVSSSHHLYCCGGFSS